LTFVFVSHAAPDKLDRVRPLAHALALEGVRLWLDRPGVGDSHFNFDDAFLQRHGIQGLQAGVGWDDGIRRALRDSSAVLVCLSRTSVEPARRVLLQEITIGWYEEKIVPCIVDDLSFEDIPSDLGLPDLVRTQSERIDPLGLQQCLIWLAAAEGRRPDDLPAQLKPAWQPVRKLRADLEAAGLRKSRIRSSAEPSARVAALHALVVSTPRPLLMRIYRASLPDPSRELSFPSITALLRHLDDSRPRLDALPSPLIEFVERLVRVVNDAALREWLAHYTADDRAAHAELTRQLNRAANRPPRATLFVDVDPDVQHQLRWWIHAANPKFCTAETVVDLSGPLEADLGECLGRCLAQAERRIGTDCTITVALLLPKRLLSTGLESLNIPSVDEESTEASAVLHRSYPVTLHWRKRARARGKPGTRSINAWNAALDALMDRISQGAGANVVWVDLDPNTPDVDDAPFAEAAARLRNPSDDAICVGLSPRPPAADGRPLGARIEACLNEGIPCFFWFSQPPLDFADPMRQAVSSEFARHRPCDAPTEVGQLRMRVGAASPFSSLCLVWDEPGHVHVPDILSDEATA
jgi:TIR domain